MATNTQLSIIAHLLNHDEPQTIRGLARQLGKAYPLVYNAIPELVRQEIVLKKSAPPAQIISLNPHTSPEMLIEAERKIRHDFLQQNKWLAIFLQDVQMNSPTSFFVFLIFGSHAQGKQTAKSDLDLLLIVPRAEDSENIEQVVREVYTKVPKHLITVREEHFLEMIKNSRQFNVGNEARKHHILLYGIEEYYQLLEKAKA